MAMPTTAADIAAIATQPMIERIRSLSSASQERLAFWHRFDVLRFLGRLPKE
jgi:hypothetical protein